MYSSRSRIRNSLRLLVVSVLFLASAPSVEALEAPALKPADVCPTRFGRFKQAVAAVFRGKKELSPQPASRPRPIVGDAGFPGLRQFFDDEIPRGAVLGTGEESDAFLTPMENWTRVYIERRNLSSDAKALRKLRPQEQEALRNLDLRQAQSILRMVQARGDDDPLIHLLDQLRVGASDLLVSVDEMRSLSRMSYQGHPIAPRIYGIVRNALGIPCGYLTERIPGITLHALESERGALTPSMKEEIRRQLLRQIQFLRSHGKIHGDLNTKNILIERGPHGQIGVRLIDFKPHGHEAGSDVDLKRIAVLFPE